MEEIRIQAPGNIWKVLVKEGDQVARGAEVFIMELMKTEAPHVTKIGGIVKAVYVSEGQEGLDA
jgi:acetyl-CoA carboxylase biotin carboxyl carrier protein